MKGAINSHRSTLAPSPRAGRCTGRSADDAVLLSVALNASEPVDDGDDAADPARNVSQCCLVDLIVELTQEGNDAIGDCHMDAKSVALRDGVTDEVPLADRKEVVDEATDLLGNFFVGSDEGGKDLLAGHDGE